MLCFQMSFQRFEFLPIFKADEMVMLNRLFDRNSGYWLVLTGFWLVDLMLTP
ncbi:hypothetical protein SAMN03080618_03370 [Aquamicrobium aerolatum DSM 21857]|uniref:Uncharacterized protein n=1 Tax=Aquamicrobium aerolatum DSM 21857 TaxID=1121003 RepID=A0A1I3SHB9_9HYPH|nr:hypothetical protein SAMN03080618_03370 [Aquamicrobium aerolatum DSM 21857]